MISTPHQLRQSAESQRRFVLRPRTPLLLACEPVAVNIHAVGINRDLRLADRITVRFERLCVIGFQAELTLV